MLDMPALRFSSMCAHTHLYARTCTQALIDDTKQLVFPRAFFGDLVESLEEELQKCVKQEYSAFQPEDFKSMLQVCLYVYNAQAHTAGPMGRARGKLTSLLPSACGSLVPS